jgi:hypothetical protein
MQQDDLILPNKLTKKQQQELTIISALESEVFETLGMKYLTHNIPIN